MVLFDSVDRNCVVRGLQGFPPSGFLLGVLEGFARLLAGSLVALPLPLGRSDEYRSLMSYVRGLGFVFAEARLLAVVFFLWEGRWFVPGRDGFRWIKRFKGIW